MSEYKSELVKDKLMRRTGSAWIGRDLSRGLVNPEKPSFTREASEAKSYIPGVGKYQPNFEVISKPYSKKRV